MMKARTKAKRATPPEPPEPPEPPAPPPPPPQEDPVVAVLRMLADRFGELTASHNAMAAMLAQLVTANNSLSASHGELIEELASVIERLERTEQKLEAESNWVVNAFERIDQDRLVSRINGSR